MPGVEAPKTPETTPENLLEVKSGELKLDQLDQGVKKLFKSGLDFEVESNVKAQMLRHYVEEYEKTAKEKVDTSKLDETLKTFESGFEKRAQDVLTGVGMQARGIERVEALNQFVLEQTRQLELSGFDRTSEKVRHYVNGKKRELLQWVDRKIAEYKSQEMETPTVHEMADKLTQQKIMDDHMASLEREIQGR